jgi:hypothetical protein
MERLTFNLLNPTYHEQMEARREGRPWPPVRTAPQTLNIDWGVVSKSYWRNIARKLRFHRNPGSDPALHLSTKRREIFRESHTGRLTCRLTKMEWNIIKTILQKEPATTGELASLVGCKNTDALYVAVCRFNKKVRGSLNVSMNMVRDCRINHLLTIPNPFGDETL